MKITFIIPPTVDNSKLLSYRQAIPSPGVPYLASFLEAQNHQTLIIDALGLALDKTFYLEKYKCYVRGLNIEEIIKRIPTDSDIIAFSIMYSNSWVYVKKLIKEAKKLFQKKIFIAGGEHVTADYDQLLKGCSQIDYLVLGEGEITLAELLDAIENSKDLHLVDGIAYRKNNQIIKTAARKRNNNLDSLPFPKWDKDVLENYLSLNSGMTTINKRIMPIITSRGCVYQCSFCTNQGMWGNHWISRKIENIICEIKFYISEYKINHLELHDLTAGLDKSHICNFAKQLVANSIKISWSLPAGTRCESLDRETFSLLKKSGCNKISFAPESGSSSVLKKMDKRLSLKKILEVMSLCVQEQITVRAHIILGFPDQSFKDSLSTYFFIIKMALIGVHDVSIFKFVPLPGTTIFEDLKAHGVIPTQEEEYEYFLVNDLNNNEINKSSFCKNFTPKQLNVMMFFGLCLFYFLQFFFRPYRLVKSLICLIKKDPVSIFDNLLFYKIYGTTSKTKQ
ncbi:MAG: B12-binding domain-containing radical SAM protein [Oligoflexia bacterium]|nr:B12-binding domain-containing radical SAM protein [Oligoflexia bacterium]